jgi:hypothetical protein
MWPRLKLNVKLIKHGKRICIGEGVNSSMRYYLIDKIEVSSRLHDPVILAYVRNSL